MTEKYYPEPVPYTDDLPYIREFLFREFLRISASFEGVREIELEELSVEPTARAGMIKFADGVNWDPGNGKGFYGYDGTSWIMLSPGYEAGSWTPGITFNNAAVGMTFSLQSGAYIKIGKFIHCGGRVTLSAKGSSTGAARLTGFPFMSSGNNNSGTVVFNLISGMSGLTTLPIASIISATSAIFRGLNVGGTGTQDLNDTHFTNTTDLRFTCTYITD